MKVKVISIIFSALLLTPLTTYAQVEQGRQLNMSQQFRLGDRFIRVAEPGQLVDSVNVWGDVNSAGRYLVPVDTRLPELISYSFGPSTIRDRESNLDWSKMRLEVKVSRFDKNRRRVEVANFKYKYSEPEPVELFEYELRNNDIVTLQVKRKPAFIDYVRVIAPVISSVATGFLIVERLR
ncbi:hypothetical protein G3570_04770 [Balneolaceae bacterium YR4-1]|uniref:Soluble ligand binding domain-containing protein n=1 Tax=Halalkalibaculum roseum TaxID=2709311 RepID=A0A6M1T1L1_9BACT|nr:hypothetical protein [Halalkalibaculum roseum]NGP75935.1 hypothetical protein [Halalkalibaculum roseum]